MPIVVPVYFDYASSLCAIAASIGAQLEADLDVTFDWRPVEIAAQYPHWKKGDRVGDETRAKIARVSAETGVPIAVPERWLDSRAALEGAFFARAHGRFCAYHERVFIAAFASRDDIADRRVLTRIAQESGLPVGEFMMALATRAHAPELSASVEEARRLGVVGYPTFLLGELPLTGIQPIETMRLLFQRHIERSRDRLLH
jgi:predicted DsbA family dithiol-disulfide isomerase